MNLFIIIIIGLCNSFFLKNYDDPVYYVKITNTRTYMNIDRVTITEYWFSKDKYCTLSNQRKTIVRKDIGITYFINLGSGTYRADSIKPQKITDSIKLQKTELKVGKTMDFKYIGQNYISEYEWNKPKPLSMETIGGYVCEHYICEGDADFDRISLEFLMAKTDDQFIVSMLNNTILNLTGSNNKREPIIRMINGNKNLIPLRIIENIENPIAPHVTTTINVDKLDLVKSPGDLFDLPDKLTKIN